METVIDVVPDAEPAAAAQTSEPAGTRVDVIDVDHQVGGRQVLHGISLSVESR